VKFTDLAASSLRLIGVLASGETPTGAEVSDALTVCNQMLDSWAADRLMVFTLTIGEFTLTPGKQTYTMGTSGDFNVPRPPKLDDASIVSLTNPAQPLELPIKIYNDNEWQGIPLKSVSTTLPQGFYDDGGFPLRNLSFWPIPTVAVKTRIYSWTPLSTFPDLITDVTFPPGYIEALRYNLAVRLIAEMPGNFNPIMVQTTLQLANESLARIKSINITAYESRCDSALVGGGGRYNYLSDTIVGGR
jgi:hypothetical protein